MHVLGVLIIYCYLRCHGPVQEFDRVCSGDSFMNHARQNDGREGRRSSNLICESRTYG